MVLALKKLTVWWKPLAQIHRQTIGEVWATVLGTKGASEDRGVVLQHLRGPLTRSLSPLPTTHRHSCQGGITFFVGKSITQWLAVKASGPAGSATSQSCNPRQFNLFVLFSIFFFFLSYCCLTEFLNSFVSHYWLADLISLYFFYFLLSHFEHENIT